jgi:hypothetical protein
MDKSPDRDAVGAFCILKSLFCGCCFVEDEGRGRPISPLAGEKAISLV